MKYFIIIGSIILVIVLVAVVWGFVNKAKAGDEQTVLTFIQEHPDTTSFTLVQNGEVLVERNGDQLMPLASTVKIIIAIEYAKQAANGTIQAQEAVPLEQLGMFYIKNLDGGAHPAWLKSMEEQGKITNGAVTLEEVAKGMIQFSSNANTEYLMDKLGMDRINASLSELELRNHEPLHPIVSDTFIPYELMKKYPDLSAKEAILKAKEDMRQMTPEQYRQHAMDIHENLLKPSNGAYTQAANLPSWYDSELDRMSTERFTQSTTQDYATLMQKLNSKTFFDAEVYAYLDPVMEALMESPRNQEWLQHAGLKGGSTAFVLTEAFYATEKNGTKTEYALFFNDLTSSEVSSLGSGLNSFKLKFLKDPAFRSQVLEQLK